MGNGQGHWTSTRTRALSSEKKRERVFGFRILFVMFKCIHTYRICIYIDRVHLSTYMYVCVNTESIHTLMNRISHTHMLLRANIKQFQFLLVFECSALRWFGHQHFKRGTDPLDWKEITSFLNVFYKNQRFELMGHNLRHCPSLCRPWGRPAGGPHLRRRCKLDLGQRNNTINIECV